MSVRGKKIIIIINDKISFIVYFLKIWVVLFFVMMFNKKINNKSH